ncbi:sulfatase-like hydrolase/transferase [Poriferisphaera sp. WC338]|uniref:sulfatase-like hydrolase/transferase n=1 Tax=Poriferisphaera sp. WC338 TaxID=3425129 RepID=UPI003D8191DB
MNNQSKLRQSAMLMAGCFGTFTASHTLANVAGESAPNVVFILADDIGYGDLGSFGGLVPTPNIDRLAAEGITFTDAHSPDALCAPSRFSLMTGSNPYRNGRPGGSWNINNSSAFSANASHTAAGKHVTVGDVMQSAGYKTAFFGKMHFGGDAYDSSGNLVRSQNQINDIDMSRTIGDTINQHGFDYSYGLQSGIQYAPYAFFENGKFAPIDPSKPADNSSTTMMSRTTISGPNGDSITAGPNPALADVDYNSSQVGIQLSNKAVDFIDNHMNSNPDTPFMMYYASQAIHVPHTPPVDFDGDPSTIDQPVAGHTGGTTSDMIYELDLQVGKILDKLEAEGIADNTLIIFTSDNGGLDPVKTKATYGDPNHKSAGDLRDWKTSVYEGGHRVPFIAKWGDGTEAGSLIKPGSVSDQTIGGMDWVASMYDLTGQTMEADQAMDSVSLLPEMLGALPTNQTLREYLFSFGALGKTGDPANDLKGKEVAIRMGDLVLLATKDGTPFELFDLGNDLAQQVNLINEAQYADEIQQMRQFYLDHNDQLDPRSTTAVDYSDPNLRTTWGAVPEPGSMMMLTAGTLMLAKRRR